MLARLSKRQSLVALILLILPLTVSGRIIYVDDDGPGRNDPPAGRHNPLGNYDGSTWETAFCFLQDALQAVKDGDVIHLAQGDYYNTLDSLSPQGLNRTFVPYRILKDISIMGGYAGLTGHDPNERDHAKYISCLKGLVTQGDTLVSASGVLEIKEKGPSVQIDGLTFQYGRGLSIREASPTISNCTFKDHIFGAIYCSDNSRPFISYCLFDHTVRTNITGGAVYIRKSSVVIDRCTFINNTAGSGSAIYLDTSNDHSLITNSAFLGNMDQEAGCVRSLETDCTFINCVFSGNNTITTSPQSYKQQGGAILFENSDLTLINCTIVGHSARQGAAIAGKKNHDYSSNRETSLSIHNCLLWGNIGTQLPSQISLSETFIEMSHTIIQGGKAGVISDMNWLWHPSNMQLDPLLVAPKGADNIAGTLDDNLYVRPGSPALDKGDNTVLPDSIQFDMGGGQRRLSSSNTTPLPIVDIGAYEGSVSTPKILTSTHNLILKEGTRHHFFVSLANPPLGQHQVELSYQDEDPAITIIEPVNGYLLFDGRNHDIPQKVIVQANKDIDSLMDQATIQISAFGYLNTSVIIDVQDTTIPPRVIYVDHHAHGNKNGNSWTNAFHTIKQAVHVAQQNLNVIEIRIAEGEYLINSLDAHDRQSLTLRPGLSIRGGYAGFGSQDPNERNTQKHETILSGDLGYNDSTPRDKRHRTFSPSKPSENTLGLICYDGIAIDSYCTLDGLTLSNGTGQGFLPQKTSGGINILNGASPLISNCTIQYCSGILGGGTYIDGNPIFLNCIFRFNYSMDGGAVYRGRGFPIFYNCNFFWNSASYYGGAINCFNADIAKAKESLSLVNCSFFNNKARIRGSYLNITGCHAKATNCIFWGQTDDPIKPIHVQSYTYQTHIPGSLEISHSVVQGGIIEIFVDPNSQLNTVTPIIDQDPLYIDPCGPDEYDWIEHIDLRLQSNSPCINTGQDIDIPFDFSHHIRQHGERTDIGAYEFNSSPISEIVYVDQHAQGNNTGHTWNHAFTDLQKALLTARGSLSKVKEIHVARGTYYPSKDIQNRSSSFQLQTGVRILGGFPIGGGPLNQRNPEMYPTILSGDRLQNDLPNTMVPRCFEGQDNSYHVVDGSYTDHTAVLDGFMIEGGHVAKDEDKNPHGAGLYITQGDPKIVNCIFKHNIAEERGSAIGCRFSSPTFVNCRILDCYGNDLYFQEGAPYIHGNVEISSCSLLAENTTFTGHGRLLLNTDSLLNLNDVTIQCHVKGPGTLHVNVDAELIVKDQAVVDLAGASDEYGEVLCDGLFNIRDESLLTNADVSVFRANVEGDAIITNCVVNAEAGAPYGQFYIEGQAQLALESIWADGDRYLDVDPATFDCTNIQVKDIQVEITEGIGGTHGGLFELRGLDLALPSVEHGYLHQVTSEIPPFNPITWTLNRLELLPEAKLNLTNRFDFQSPYSDEGGAYEVLYVKHLILGADSVLNTSYNKIYYETLTMDPSAQIVSIPLLGFSLNNVSFDNDNDYLARVIHNNTTHNPHLVKRIVGQQPDPNGFLQFKNSIDANPDSLHPGRPIHARAKALFAKASEPEIDIRFEYLFKQASPGTELVVYLTDAPPLLDPHDPTWQDHMLEVARLIPPPHPFPGSLGSKIWGVFHQTVRRRHLNFKNGTRVEFALHGPAGTCLWINNWDPGIRCVSYCGDVAGALYQISAIDYLAAISECGHRVSEIDTLGGSEGSCLEGFFCRDGMVTLHDAMAIDFSIGYDCTCPSSIIATGKSSLQPTMHSASASPTILAMTLSTAPPLKTNGLHILGKSYQNGEFLQESVYSMTEDSAHPTGPQALSQRLNIKLFRDTQGHLYTLNLRTGLALLSTPETPVIPPQILSHDGNTVYLGYHELPENHFTSPILDAIWGADQSIYIAPVTVQTPQGSYQAIAKLQANEDGIYQLEALYTRQIPGILVEGLREVALDHHGHLYALSIDQLRQQDILWIFDEITGKHLGQIPLNQAENGIPAPQNLHIAGNTLYLTSAVQTPDANASIIYGLSIEKILAMTNTSLTDSQQPIPIVREISIENLGHVTDMTHHPETGSLWVTGFTMPTVPTSDKFGPFGNLMASPPFYLPYFAEIHPNDNQPVEAMPLSNETGNTSTTLALPLSITW